MIEALIRISGPDAKAPLKANSYGIVAESVLTGVGFVLLVPILDNLAQDDHDTAGLWLAVLATLVLVYTVLRFRTQLIGYRAAITLGRALFRRIGAHISSLPLGWFNDERAGELSRMTGHGVVDIIGIPAHLLRLYISAVATPATVVLLMFLFDWRLAMAALITAPAAALLMRWTGSLVERHEHRANTAAIEAVNRIVEFGQAQPVLRAFDYDGEAHSKINAAFDEQHAAGRNLMVSAASGLMSFIGLLQVAFTVILLFGTSLALGGEIDAPELVALLVLTARYIEPLITAADLEGA
ncbi:MAG: ABC transporter ATP-binding protein, partial [Pseudomonadota bacterium]